MLTRSRLALAAALLLLCTPGLATAHAGFVSSTPAPGSNQRTAPTQVRITFGAELDLDGSSFTVTDAAGGKVGSGTVDMSVAGRNVLAGRVAITRPGLYAVKWTSLSTDGDNETGAFSFSVGTIPPPGAEQPPDTSVASSPMVDLRPLLGAVLLLLGAVILARRPTRR